MDSLGKYIRARRTAKGLSVREVSESSGISQTEVSRIETGKRKQPSMRVLIALARTLEIPDHTALQLAGYKSEDDENISILEKTFPGLKTEKLQSTAQKMIDGLVSNNDLKNSDYDKLMELLEMFWDYRRARDRDKKKICRVARREKSRADPLFE